MYQIIIDVKLPILEVTTISKMHNRQLLVSAAPFVKSFAVYELQFERLLHSQILILNASRLATATAHTNSRSKVSTFEQRRAGFGVHTRASLCAAGEQRQRQESTVASADFGRAGERWRRGEGQKGGRLDSIGLKRRRWW